MRPIGLILGIVLPLTACVSVPDFHSVTKSTAPPARFDASSADSGKPVPLDEWWQAWGDPALDALVAKALAANRDIRAARAHVAAARALVAVSESALYPSVSATGAVWGALGDNKVQGPLGASIEPYSTGNLGVVRQIGIGANWEPDFFGGRRADVATAKAFADGSVHMANAVRITIVADVVENYQQLQGLTVRLAILDHAIIDATRLTAYVAARRQAGQATMADLARVRLNLEELKSQRGPLAALIDTRRRRLAVLAGDLPEAEVSVSAPDLLVVPEVPGGQLPSSVLERRPDVQARLAIVEGSAARVASLKADFKPRFGIQFVGQNAHLELSGLPGYAGTGGLLGVTASVPLFMGGRLRARVAAGSAELDAALAEYDQSLLAALEDIEAAYVLRAGFDYRLAGLVEAQRLAAQRVVQLEALYAAGRSPLGDALAARLGELQAQDQVEQARTAQRTATVQLFRALAGGWNDKQP